MNSILKFDFQKCTQLHFSEENYLNFFFFFFANDNYIFPKTKANKNKWWTHYSALKAEDLSWAGPVRRRNATT